MWKSNSHSGQFQSGRLKRFQITNRHDDGNTTAASTAYFAFFISYFKESFLGRVIKFNARLAALSTFSSLTKISQCYLDLCSSRVLQVKLQAKLKAAKCVIHWCNLYFLRKCVQSWAIFVWGSLWQRKLRCESSSELGLDGLTNGGGERQFAVTRHANKGWTRLIPLTQWIYRSALYPLTRIGSDRMVGRLVGRSDGSVALTMIG